METASTSNSEDVQAPRECMAHVKEFAKSTFEDPRRKRLDLRPRLREGASFRDVLAELSGRFTRASSFYRWARIWRRQPVGENQGAVLTDLPGGY